MITTTSSSSWTNENENENGHATTTAADFDDDTLLNQPTTKSTSTKPLITTTTTALTAQKHIIDDHHHDDDGGDVDEKKKNLASMILHGQASFPSSSNNKEELKFVPGSLTLSSKETLRYCYTNTTIYWKHLRTVVMLTYSPTQKIMYRHLPKSGSSTVREIFKSHFEDTKFYQFNMPRSHQQDAELTSNYTHIFTFIRDPLSRFYSSYDEAFEREAPWGLIQRQHPDRISPAPTYLYKGFNNSYENFVDTWCPPSTRTGKDLQKNRRQCFHDGRSTKENGTLAARFIRYVHEGDLLDPFDTHLRLQVPLLTSPQTGRMLHIDEIYNNVGDVNIWHDIAKHHTTTNLSLGSSFDHIPKARSRSRTYDIKFVSNSTKQKICEFALLDYCCLNIKLPPPCNNLYCKLHYGTSETNLKNEEEVVVVGQQDQQDDDDDDDDSRRRLLLQIEPWTFPT